MKTIVFSSIKGGSGKSSHVIMTANCLGRAGFKVLVIDMDLNNATSFYYATPEWQKTISELNIASALSRADNDLNNFIITTEKWNVDLIASSLYLVDLRGVSDKRLAQLLPTLEDKYDFVFIDTQPTYDNLVLSAYNAADIIITPVNLCTFDYNTAAFLRDKIETETVKSKNWFITINGYNSRYAQSKNGIQKEYIDYFKADFKLTPAQTWLPWTSSVRKITDQGMFLAEKKIPNMYQTTLNPSLFNSVYEMASWIAGKPLNRMEEF